MAPPASEAGCRPNLPSSGKFSLALRRLPPGGRIQLDQLAIRCEQGAERTREICGSRCRWSSRSPSMREVRRSSAAGARRHPHRAARDASARACHASAHSAPSAPCLRASSARAISRRSSGWLRRALLTRTAARSAAVALDTGAGWCGPEAPCGLAPVVSLTHHRNIAHNASRLCHAFSLATGLANRIAPCRKPDMLRKQAS
jgi:hypothetical protein